MKLIKARHLHVGVCQTPGDLENDSDAEKGYSKMQTQSSACILFAGSKQGAHILSVSVADCEQVQLVCLFSYFSHSQTVQ